MNRLHLAFLFTIISPALFAQSGSEEDIFNVISQRVVSDHSNLSVQILEKEITYYLSIILIDGSFSDINYGDKSRPNWEPQSHLLRVNRFVFGYIREYSPFYKDSTLYRQIVKSLEFWNTRSPVSDNWWWQRVSTPQNLGIIMLAMRNGEQQLPKELEDSLLQWMVKHSGDPSEKGGTNEGANKMDIATHWIYRGLLTRNETVLAKGIDQAFHPIHITTGTGFQEDWSYHQHGPQLYIGGYGKVMLLGAVNIAKYLYGTPYALSKEKIEILRNFTLETFLPCTRGKLFLFNVLGRSIARHNGLNQQASIPMLQDMKKIDPEYADEYEKGIQRISGKQPANYQIIPKHTHYWRSDYTLHQRPDYTVDVRFATVGMRRSEIVNNENLLGYFLVDGGMCIAKTGNEYENIFPVWDWTAIPGTTAPQLTPENIPRFTNKKPNGSATFAGGVSDGAYGVTCYFQNDYTYKQTRIEAKKSWFFFDDEIVCLGTGIKSKSKIKSNVRTTLNQCLLNGDIEIGCQGKTVQITMDGMHSFTDSIDYVLHDEVGYFFPTPLPCVVNRETRTGNWNHISPVDKNETKDVFSLWIDHGKKVKNADYQYIIIPNMQGKDATDNPLDDILILANNSKIQAVYHRKLDILGIVFYEAGTFKHNGLIELTVDKPAILIIRDAIKKQTLN
ncbi:polysaccharide lyase beta-sandwich domain-containing protein [Bacteroidales bacterium OttesenSCG-928-B11]|nr:polysaccharide lyase beta-sandwich domain-containing protein [Bacteroidales bacterium OttesenSCG-928-B11]MDL2325986.1 polysaccharide lyase beta-sandwich domain-containing protein [Bacteroidales bacterium OttesenSCG-928-A14]